MFRNLLLIWIIQGSIALCQGRVLYLYLFTSGRQDIEKTLLITALLYAVGAVSMVILLLVYHGKRDLRITRHAYWTTVIFPAIATVIAGILYIKVSTRFFLGLLLLLLAAILYFVAGLSLSMLLVRIFGHSSFRPILFGSHKSVKIGYDRHGSIGRTINSTKGTRNREQSSYQQGGSGKRSVVFPDYQQEYIDKVNWNEAGRNEQEHKDNYSLVNDPDRPVYSGGTKTRVKVAYINRENQMIRCNESSSGYGRLGRIASTGEIYKYSGGSDVYAGHVTAAGYVRNAAGLDIGCIDDDGNVFRYEGEGALDMTHAKTLIGKVNQGDYAAGAAFLLLYEAYD